MDQPDEPRPPVPDLPEPEPLEFEAEPLAPAPVTLDLTEEALPPGQPPEEPRLLSAAPGPACVDLNTATADELSRLPGVTATIAARIVDYREQHGPFPDTADLRKVRGVSKALYTRIADQLVVSAIPAPEEAKPVVEVALPEEAAPAVEAALPEQPAPAGVVVKEPIVPSRPAAAPPPLQFEEVEPARGPGWPAMLIVGLVSILLGACLALAIVAAVNNGTLEFGRAAAVRGLEGDVQQLDRQAQQLTTDLEERARQFTTDLDGLRAGVERGQAGVETMSRQLQATQGQLEALDSGLAKAQSELQALRSEMREMGGNVSSLEKRAGALESQLAELGQQVRDIRAAAARFDAFLGGLRALLNESQPAVTPAQPGLEPGSLTPQPTPGITATPRPRVKPTATP